MFIVASFIIAKKWKQPKSPSTDEQNMAYLHNKILLNQKMKYFYMLQYG